MKKIDGDKMIKRGRIILGPWETIAHYGFILVIGTVNILLLVIVWNQSPPKPTNAMLTNNEVLVITALCVLIFVVFFLILRERLRLTKETIDLDEEEILDVVNQVGKKFNWDVKSLTKDFIQADLIRIIGTDHRITIFIRDKDVYINCRAKNGQIFGWFRQERITERFMKALKTRNYELKHKMEMQANPTLA